MAKNQVYLLRDLHIESLPAGFTGFPGHLRAPRRPPRASSLAASLAFLLSDVTAGRGCGSEFGDRSASPPDSSLIWGSFGHSG